MEPAAWILHPEPHGKSGESPAHDAPVTGQARLLREARKDDRFMLMLIDDSPRRPRTGALIENRAVRALIMVCVVFMGFAVRVLVGGVLERDAAVSVAAVLATPQR
jgi:hypothetical protein